MLRARLLLPVPASLLFAVFLMGTPAAAQVQVTEGAPQAVVQGLPTNDSMNLNAALARLGRNPRDLQALIDAGQAALLIGDVDAAIGFYSRAEQVMPGTPRVKAGLARALVRSGNPYDALPLFEEAEKGGATDSDIAIDRGLAYDLVADNASAQRYYRLALAGGENEEATRRLAISLAIAGDRRGSASVLSPLLLRQDKASWRARAFSLAILGQADEAISVVNTTLPAQLAAGIAPYLRYMPRLTPAQQAAAANFGQFPRASEIGRDDPRVALLAPSGQRKPALASNDSALIPRGEPLGRNTRSREARPASRQRGSERQRPPEVAAALPAPQPAQPALQQSGRSDNRSPASRQPQIMAAATPRPATSAGPAPLLPPVQPSRVQSVTGPSATVPPPLARPAAPPPTPRQPTALASATRSQTARVLPPPAAVFAAPLPPASAVAVRPAAAPVPPPSRPAPPVPPTPRRVSLDEAFSDLAQARADVTPAAGAVDIRRIRPAREPAAGSALSLTAAPSHPSRIWVQLATGRDRTALSYDWRRIARAAEAAFKNRRPSISTWGQSNRLLAGPFQSEAAAATFQGQLRRANIDGAFVWTSPAGQVVDALAAR